MNRKNKIGPLLGILAIAVAAAAAVAFVPRVLKDEETQSGNASVPLEDYFGTWQAEEEERFIITVWREGDGIIYVNMDRESRTESVEFWECTATYEAGEGLSYNDCIKTTTFYTDDDGRTTDNYENGSGSLKLVDGLLYWEDDREDAAEGLAFAWVGEY